MDSLKKILLLQRQKQRRQDTRKIFNWIIKYNTTTNFKGFKNRQTRERLFKSLMDACRKNDSGDTRAIIEKLVRLRMQKSTINGF